MLSKLSEEEIKYVTGGWIYKTMCLNKKFKYIIYDNKTNLCYLTTYNETLAKKTDLKRNKTISYNPLRSLINNINNN